MTERKAHILYEEFANFLEKPARDTLRDLLRRNLGELDQLDFKEDWPEKSTLARHVLAMANSKGGSIVFGVEDGSMDPKGLAAAKDKAEAFQELQKYVPPSLLEQLEIMDFKYEASEYPRLDGKTFQVLRVPDDTARIPFIASAGGDKIRNASVYVRKGTESVEADYEDLQRLVNRRLETGLSSTAELDIRDHLTQLRILYQQLSPTRDKGGGLMFQLGDMARSLLQIQSEPNPDYPTEGLDAFVARAIELKKRKVLAVLGVGPHANDVP
jgi:hypothetical protein